MQQPVFKKNSGLKHVKSPKSSDAYEPSSPFETAHQTLDYRFAIVNTLPYFWVNLPLDYYQNDFKKYYIYLFFVTKY